MRAVIPTEGFFASWAQNAAIFKDAPHPAAARLLMNFALSTEWQEALVESGWSVREDLPLPKGFDKSLMDMENTNPLAFSEFMADRAAVEHLRFWYEDRIGTAQGLSPLTDGI